MHLCRFSLSESDLLFTKLKILPQQEKELSREHSKHVPNMWEPIVKYMWCVLTQEGQTVSGWILQELPFHEVVPYVTISVNRGEKKLEPSKLKISFWYKNQGMLAVTVLQQKTEFLLTCNRLVLTFVLGRTLSVVTIGPLFKLCFPHRTKFLVLLDLDLKFFWMITHSGFGQFIFF